MIDIHSHILFGVDDGAQSIEESVEMLRSAKMVGIDRIIATPHIKSPDADIAQMIDNYKRLAPIATEIGINLSMGYECNIMAVNTADYCATARFCISDTSILLLEFPFDNWPFNWDRNIYKLQAAGLQIIIAHPERYLPIQRDISKFDTMADLGCIFQVNAASLLKCRGDKYKAVKYIKKMHRLDYIASDAHSAADYLVFGNAIKKYTPTFDTINQSFFNNLEDEL